MVEWSSVPAESSRAQPSAVLPEPDRAAADAGAGPTIGAAPVPVSPLRSVSIFADLSDDDLAWIAAQSELVELEPGELLFAFGDRAEWMFIGLEGVVQARREQLGAGAPPFVFRAGDVTGTIPFSRMKEFSGTGRATTRARVARFPKWKFDELLDRLPLLTLRFVALLADRVRDATRRDAQFEKLNALGRLAAGIAHELNNPASAVQRSGADARRRLARRSELAAEIVRVGVKPDDVLALDRLRADAAEGRLAVASMDTLARAEREDALVEWLSDCDVPEPWTWAATFTDAGLDEAGLERALGHLDDTQCLAALRWLESLLAEDALLATVGQGAARIATLVDAVRRYTHVDRARDMTDVDVREGLDATLTLYAQRIREKGIAVDRSYATDLPRVRAFPGDLNQAWANLIDNAIDAAPPSTGRLALRAGTEDGAVVVEVCDNGPGIPAELLDRIWDPFFTTKDVGQGTGLGLDIARRIVADEHGGVILLDSRPGDTRFVVKLPLTTVGTIGA